MRLLRKLAGAAGALAASAALIGVVTHYSSAVSSTAARLAAFAPLLLLCAVPAVLLLVLARRRWAALLAVLLLGVGVWTQLPLFLGPPAADATADTVRVRLMQANIRLGEAAAPSLVDTVRARGVDLLTVIELTPGAARRLSDAGIDESLPYSMLWPREGGGGAGIYSTFPLRDGALLDGFELNNVRAVAEIPGAAPTAVYALHPLAPYPEPAWKWVAELRRLCGQLTDDLTPLLVGADFNSTYDHRQFRELVRNATAADGAEMRDAAEYLGAGIVPTYPAGRRTPALLAIDRILARGAVPLSFHRIELPGSDHYGVIGDIGLAPAG